jgi:hypothetical protein
MRSLLIMQILLSSWPATALSSAEKSEAPQALRPTEGLFAPTEAQRKQIENLAEQKTSVIIQMRDGGVWAGEPERADENRLWLSVRDNQGSGLVALTWKRISLISQADGQIVWSPERAFENLTNETPLAAKAKEEKTEDFIIHPRKKAVPAKEVAVLPEKGVPVPKVNPLEEKVKEAELERKLLVLEAENAILRRGLEREKGAELAVEPWLSPVYYGRVSPVYGYYPVYRERLRSYGTYVYARRGGGAFYATSGDWGLRYGTRRGNTSYAFQIGSWDSPCGR